jgi:hypothetical protein
MGEDPYNVGRMYRSNWHRVDPVIERMNEVRCLNQMNEATNEGGTANQHIRP